MENIRLSNLKETSNTSKVMIQHYWPPLPGEMWEGWIKDKREGDS